MEKVVYYYVLYLRAKNNPEDIEIHLKPFNTKGEAEAYQLKTDKHFGKRVYFSKNVVISTHGRSLK